ncbi:unnamed protein product [Caenorhabditis sp. 36 PRJEB53466]|nr:unnamed protein product [Caenorhabditis sp. 36 PRJEB53466]
MRGKMKKKKKKMMMMKKKVVKVDQLHNPFEWGAPDVPQPQAVNPMPPPPNPPNYYAPRRSISTITGPSRRDVDAFYQHNFRQKLNGDQPEYQPTQQGPSITSGHSHQTNHLPTKNVSYEALRFSPPNVTPPPPQFPANNFQDISTPAVRAPRVRFDELPNYPTPNNFSVPPRKCSLAPNFFSSQNSHHMYPDQYTPRTWQHNEFMSNPQPQQQMAPPSHPYPPVNQQQWRSQPIENSQMSMRKHSRPAVSIKLEHMDHTFATPQQQPQHDMMEVTSGQPKAQVKSEMLSPIKMEVVEQLSSPSFLLLKQQQLEQKRSHHNVPSRKASIMALKSQLRTPRGTPLNNSAAPGTELLPYTPPPILAPMRNGSGLFCQIAKSVNSLPITDKTSSSSSDAPSCSSTNGVNGAMKNGKKKSEDGDGPSRKNGFFYTATQTNESKFANELEALRKESWASTSSADEKMQMERKASLEAIRKESCMSDSYYDYEGPKISDPNPHINIGKQYQARVKKWCDREVVSSELDAIDDRDEIVFSSEILQDIDQEQINAFELLACSQACPRAGRNKELALHLLMENKGNIEAAVEDLLRSDTLDWEHYSTVFGYMYNDSVYWTPDEIYLFQDAIYKSEKEFDKVAAELPGKTVQECVQFYYTWKKACPDDYRKLRNLRRKRQLLEMNLKNNKLLEEPAVPAKKISIVESGESDNESNATDASFNGNGHMEFRERAFTSPIISSPRDEALVGLSPSSKDLFGIQKNYQPSAPRAHHTPSASSSKKGAQPSADGFFHCRLCDKCFEKVKSLNAHMKSHAMKARAEQEAKAHDAQIAAAAAQLSNAVNTVNTTSPLHQFTNGINIAIPSGIGSLTPQQLTPQQISLNQQLQSQLSSLSSQLNSQLNSPLTPQQQLQQFTQQQQQLVARAMQQNLFQPQTSAPLVQPSHPLIQAGLHSIH